MIRFGFDLSLDLGQKGSFTAVFGSFFEQGKLFPNGVVYYAYGLPFFIDFGGRRRIGPGGSELAGKRGS